MSAYVRCTDVEAAEIFLKTQGIKIYLATISGFNLTCRYCNLLRIHLVLKSSFQFYPMQFVQKQKKPRNDTELCAMKHWSLGVMRRSASGTLQGLQFSSPELLLQDKI